MADPVIGEWLQRALDDGLAELAVVGKKQRITYRTEPRGASGHTEVFDDPEEWVRADFWAELIYHYGYPPARIAIEVPVPDRVPGDFVDLVVCRDDARTDPYAVIECKREGISDAEFAQAVEQAVGNGTWAKLRADYVMVVAGLTRRVLDVKNFPVGERIKNVIADLPKKYLAPEEWKYRKGTDLDIEVVPRELLIAALRKCHQTLWGGGHLSPPAAFSELCKIIYVKLADENKPRKKGDPYEFQVKTGESPDGLAARLVRIYREERRRTPDVLNADMAVSSAKLQAIVEHLQAINLSGTDVDVKGVAFELFMGSFFKGDSGQYFTPRELIRFCVELAEVTFNDTIIDPACGSSGFLLYALEEIRRQAAEYHPLGTAEYQALWFGFATNNLFGIEINEEICRVAKMDMVLHGDGHTNIVCHDALAPFADLRKVNKDITAGRFTLVLTNPPFGAAVKLTEHPYLASYELGNTWTGAKTPKRKPRKSQASEIVFIERIHELLEPGVGRVVIVLPDGVLTNARTGYVREFILDRFQVQAVVSIPPAAFFHYGATVKASIVMMRKLGEGELPDSDQPVFMAEAESVGYDATGRTAPNDLPAIVESYRKFKINPAAYFVDLPELLLEGGVSTSDANSDDDDDLDEPR